jgi:spore coat protein CotH
MTIAGLNYDSLTPARIEDVKSTIQTQVASTLTGVEMADVTVVLSKVSVKADVTIKVTGAGETRAALAIKAKAIKDAAGTSEQALKDGIVNTLTNDHAALVAAAAVTGETLAVTSFTTVVVEDATPAPTITTSTTTENGVIDAAVPTAAPALVTLALSSFMLLATQQH